MGVARVFFSLKLNSILAKCFSLVLFAKKKTFLEFERSMRMGPVELVASLGGIFGLFLGFSIVSFVEILYWVVVKASRNMLRRKK